MKFKPTMSVADLSVTSTEMVSNRLILEPGAPAEILADRIIDEADPGFLKELGRSLFVQHFARLVRAKRREDSGKWREQLPPEIDRLPMRIVGKRGKRVRLDVATYTDLRDYCRFLGRKRNDPKRVQAELLRDRLKGTRDVGAGEALGFNFEE